LLLLAQVPAPQLASPFGMAFFFLATGLAAGAALAAAEALAEAGEALAEAGASAAGVVAAAAVVAGAWALGAGAAAALADLFAPQLAAEHDA
jgi:hypothetical protein